MLREARFGGTCPEIYEPFQNQKSSHLKAYFQSESCGLCREHSWNNKEKVYDWPALDYPGEDTSCVGYCPSKLEMENIYDDTGSCFQSTANGKNHLWSRTVRVNRRTIGRSSSNVKCRETFKVVSFQGNMWRTIRLTSLQSSD